MKKTLLIEFVWFIAVFLLTIPMSIFVGFTLEKVSPDFYQRVYNEWTQIDDAYLKLNRLDLFDNIFLGLLCFACMYVARFVYSAVVELAKNS